MNEKRMVLALLFLAACTQDKQSLSAVPHWHPKDGNVPDSTTAIKVAQAIMFGRMGENSSHYKRFRAVLKGDTSWAVVGAHPLNDEGALINGGVFQLEIDKKTGAVTNVEIGK